MKSCSECRHQVDGCECRLRITIYNTTNIFGGKDDCVNYNKWQPKQPDFKVGDRVRCYRDDGPTTCDGGVANEWLSEGGIKIGDVLRVVEVSRAGNLRFEGHQFLQNKNNFELIKEDNMKDKITLRELIEQGACKEGVLWFMHEISWFVPKIELQSEDGYKLGQGIYSFPSYMVAKVAKKQNKPEYIQWLKDNGYQTEDNQDKIKELEKRLDKIDEERADIRREIKELRK